MAKLILGRRQEGKTIYALNWLWEKGSDEQLAFYSCNGQEQYRLKKITKDNIRVFTRFRRGVRSEYSAIDNLWVFRRPKKLLSEVIQSTEKEVLCTMDQRIFDITTLEEVRDCP